ncbi:MAG TPA: 2-dehydropantoate 2-reductase [Terriglobales bacterium]|nr:2-dehydropantoate 2-reductase [Terriglobales bacterium]
MKHAILGAGGVGGTIGAVLGKDGDDILLLLRPASLARHPDYLKLLSPYGSFTSRIRRAASLIEPVDILWITVKALHLEAAFEEIPGDGSNIGAVVPLLNGLDHLPVLRQRYGYDRVVPATIAGEFERIAPGEIVHRSPFARLNILANGRERLAGVLERLRKIGFACDIFDDEPTLMWSKLIFLGPFALATSAANRDAGGILKDSMWREKLESCVREAVAVAQASGAKVDADKTLAMFKKMPDAMRSSMSKDVSAGRKPELDAIGGPIVRAGKARGIPTPVTRELMEMVETRMKQAA